MTLFLLCLICITNIANKIARRSMLQTQRWFWTLSDSCSNVEIGSDEWRILDVQEQLRGTLALAILSNSSPIRQG